MNSSSISDAPVLESRFLKPDGWQWGYFANSAGRTIRFGFVNPSGVTSGIVVVLPGLGEFCEKYFETARDMLGRGLSFYVMDWQGQGRSERFLSNPHKRHSVGFTQDLDDLHKLMTGYVRRAACAGPGPRLPIFFLGHSMGGHIGLRYLAAHPGMVDAAAFSGPMIRIRALSGLSGRVAGSLTGFFNRIMKESYVFGATDWRALHRPPPPLNPMSADPARTSIHNAWCLHDSTLQVGGVTFGWLHEANRSCSALLAHGVLESIDVPCLLAVPERDLLVDPGAIRRAAGRLKKGKVLDLPGCLHEVLMEKDIHRSVFLKAFDALLKDALKDCTVAQAKEGEKIMAPIHQEARLSDRIFNALELSLEQKDIAVSELLVRALELSMTRSAGGSEFVERRDYPAEVEKAMALLSKMKDGK